MDKTLWLTFLGYPVYVHEWWSLLGLLYDAIRYDRGSLSWTAWKAESTRNHTAKNNIKEETETPEHIVSGPGLNSWNRQSKNGRPECWMFPIRVFTVIFVHHVISHLVFMQSDMYLLIKTSKDEIFTENEHVRNIILYSFVIFNIKIINFNHHVFDYSYICRLWMIRLRRAENIKGNR